MVKSSLNQKEQKPSSSSELRVTETSSSSCKYTGVRKRKWGKYVSEIRLLNSRERIWLGLYDTSEKAARAFDAAQFCLRGGNAKFNFPDNPPEIANGRSMTPAEIQVAAARFAQLESDTRVENLDSQSDSPCPSVSGEAGQVDSEFTDIPLDNVFLDQFLNLDTDSNINDFGLFPGFDDFPGDFFAPPVSPSFDYWQNNNEDLSSHGSFLWNF